MFVTPNAKLNRTSTRRYRVGPSPAPPNQECLRTLDRQIYGNRQGQASVEVSELGDGEPQCTSAIHNGAHAMGDSEAAQWSAARARLRSWWRALGVGALNYITNEIVSSIPSYRVRHAWYRRIMGVDLGAYSAIHLHCYLW